MRLSKARAQHEQEIKAITKTIEELTIKRKKILESKE